MPSTRSGIPEARTLLERFANRRSAADIAALPYWERLFITRVARGLRRLPEKAAGRPKRLRSAAEKLAILRKIAASRNGGRFELQQRRFKGHRGQLDLLLAALGAPNEENEWNAWRRRNRSITPNLRRANLTELWLQAVDLRGVRLDGARLVAVQARVTDFRGASLEKANLAFGDFSYAGFCGCNLRGAFLQHAMLSEADLRGADLRGAILTGCVLNGANLGGADLRGALVWGTGVWDIQTDAATRQEGLRIGWARLDPIDLLMEFSETGTYRMPERSLVVDDLRVAHFMSMVREYDRLADVIDAASSRMVLLLGRFTGGQRRVLDGLRDALPGLGYAPVVFDFREPRDRDLIETVSTLAGMARFIIADLSNPRSTPLESHLTIPHLAIPWVPIIRASEEPFSMFRTLQRKYPWVLPLVRYKDVKHLVAHLERDVVSPAERMSARLRRLKHANRVAMA